MYKIIKNLSSAVILMAVVGMSLPATAGDAVAGKSKAMMCAGCHGADGISMSPEIPNLAGQKEAYLAKAIRDYKTGARKNSMMQSIIAGVADADIPDLAAYYASLK